LRRIEKVALSPASVLLLGENGVGKSLIAKLIHERSARAAQPLVKVNIGGIADAVFEAEMFGHVRGAYTDAKTDRVGRFEIADGGTLFLDEIGNLPLPLQPKLLRVLEDGEFERVGSSKTQRADVRLIAATNADLHAEADAGRFRRDLLYRLNTVELTIPPLRARTDDIEPLAQRFLALHGARYGRRELRIAPAALDELRRYAWPGNVRELGHVIERAVLLAEDDVVASFGLMRVPDEGQGDASIDRHTVAGAERDLIRNALTRADGNIQETARALGLTRASLYRRLQKFGLSG
jgi:transcriptional regulator with GAF, ATPase, and Fis domain